MSFEVPILLCIFNRPTLTQQVFSQIAKQKPKRLLIIADGPRIQNLQDVELVAKTREIVSQVDWQCEVSTNFSAQNLGCRQRMATGISWAFDLEQQLIVLEDDCLPDDRFFDYCQSMLEAYENDPRVGMICGDQFLSRVQSKTDSYFSKYPFVWGWASWRRAWKFYDLDMENWKHRRVGDWLEERSCNHQEHAYWRSIFQKQADGEIDTWDYSWIFNCWDNDLLSIHPKHNLVSNIGFGSDATHTTDAASAIANLPTISSTLDSTSDPLTVAWHPRQIQSNVSSIGNITSRCPETNWPSTPDLVAADSEIDRQLFLNVFQPTTPDPSSVPKRRSKIRKLLDWLGRLQAASSF